MLQAQTALLSTRLKLKNIPGMDTMLQILGREFIMHNTEKPPSCDTYIQSLSELLVVDASVCLYHRYVGHSLLLSYEYLCCASGPLC